MRRYRANNTERVRARERERQRIRRSQLTDCARQRVREGTLQRVRQWRTQRRLGENVSNDNIFYLGLMSEECKYCRAKRFPEALNCCHNGKVSLPSLANYPPTLKELFNEENECPKISPKI